jgi:hypothetical protein
VHVGDGIREMVVVVVVVMLMPLPTVCNSLFMLTCWLLLKARPAPLHSRARARVSMQSLPLSHLSPSSIAPYLFYSFS